MAGRSEAGRDLQRSPAQPSPCPSRISPRQYRRCPGEGGLGSASSLGARSRGGEAPPAPPSLPGRGATGGGSAPRGPLPGRCSPQPLPYLMQPAPCFLLPGHFLPGAAAASSPATSPAGAGEGGRKEPAPLTCPRLPARPRERGAAAGRRQPQQSGPWPVEGAKSWSCSSTRVELGPCSHFFSPSCSFPDPGSFVQTLKGGW